MDSKTVFVKTSKGEDEMRDNAHLAGDLKRTLLMIDGKATFGEISKRAAPSLRNILENVLQELESGGYIQDRDKVKTQDKSKTGNMPKMVVPLKKPAPPPVKSVANDDDEELDFTAAPKSDSPPASNQPHAGLSDEATTLRNKLAAARSKSATDMHAQQTAEALAKAEAERVAKQKAEQQARIEAENIEKARAIAEERLRVEKDAQAKAEAERIAKEQSTKENKARAEAELIAKERAAKEAKLLAEQEAKLKAEAERIAREQAAIAKVQAEKEAQARAEMERIAREKAAAEAKLRAEQEARAKAEAERIAREQAAAAAKAKAEQEARIKAEAERIAREKAAAEAKARAERDAQIKAEAERRAEEVAAAAKAQAELEIAQARAELAAVKSQTAEETKSRTQGMLAFDQAAFETNKQKSTILPGRASSATVLFFDVVGYTKLSVNKQIELKKQFNQLVSTCLNQLGEGERIILDTGDGAAIGFMQHPDDALTVAMAFRQAVTANNHQDYPALQVRIGIHLGPINVVTDMNGHNNMVGDGINDAQRIMSFAGMDQIYISRPYHDFVSRLNDEYADLFQYRGLQNDKHGREHQVYELVDASAVQPDESSNADLSSSSEFSTFEFDKFTLGTSAAATPAHVDPVTPEPAEPLPFIEPIVADEPAPNEPVIAKINEETSFAAKPDAPLPSQKKSKKAKHKSTEKPTPEIEQKQLADAQAKSWADAEQRAIETARSNAEKIAQQITQPAPVASVKPQRARKPRQPVPLGKISAGLIVLAVVALFVAPYLIPTKSYIPALEQKLSKQFQQPVQIGSLSGQLLPLPRLELHNVSIGKDQQIKLQKAQAHFSLLGLLGAVKTIDSINLEGFQADGTALEQISNWLQQLATNNEFPIERVLIDRATLDSDAVQLGEIRGEISFKTGKFSQARLTSNAGKYSLDIDASTGDKALVTITASTSALPLLPNWTFDDFTAKGELNKNSLKITDIDSRIYGGILIGDALLTWNSGWSVQGTLLAKTITMQNMISSLGGDMDGTARFKMQAPSLSKLTDEPIVDGNFSIKNGIINGMDMVETVRLRSSGITPGGRTHFDELSGDWSYTNNVYHFKQIKLSAGVLNASGTVDMSKQQLSGRASANLTVTGQSAVSLQIGGLSTSPTLRAVR